MSLTLGSGTFGTVVRVQCDGMDCARKRVPPFEGDGLDSTAVRECTLLNRFHHPYVLAPQALDILPQGTLDLYLPLALSDVAQWMYRASLGERRDMMYRVAFRTLCTLAELHQGGWVHRDIKPANILLDQDHQTYLADFGSGREIVTAHLEDLSPEWPALSLLHTADMITYPYRPPEMATHNYTTKIDIYSLGCTLINILTKEYLIDKRYLPPPPIRWKQYLDRFLSALSPDFLSAAWIQLIHSMLEFDPESRPTALELLNNEVFVTRPPINLGTVVSEPPLHRTYEPHPWFPDLVWLWYKMDFQREEAMTEVTKDESNEDMPECLVRMLVNRMDRNLAIYRDRTSTSKVTSTSEVIGTFEVTSTPEANIPDPHPLAVLACFRLVLKMITSDIPSPQQYLVVLAYLGLGQPTFPIHYR